MRLWGIHCSSRGGAFCLYSKWLSHIQVDHQVRLAHSLHVAHTWRAANTCLRMQYTVRRM